MGGNAVGSGKPVRAVAADAILAVNPEKRLARPAHISEPAGRPEGASSQLIMKCGIPNPPNGAPVRNEAVIGLQSVVTF
jgi:hypothetical protein